MDRRFGESNPNITPEERALERFTRARDAERGSGGRAGKKSVFNLNDDESAGLGFGDDDGELHLGSKNAGFTLTHGGRTIDELKGDDFAAQGLGDDDDGELDDDFGINREVEGEEREGDATRRNNFGGFGDDAGDDDVSRKVISRGGNGKADSSLAASLIAGSKAFKGRDYVRGHCQVQELQSKRSPSQGMSSPSTNPHFSFRRPARASTTKRTRRGYPNGAR